MAYLNKSGRYRESSSIVTTELVYVDASALWLLIFSNLEAWVGWMFNRRFKDAFLTSELIWSRDLSSYAS